MYLQGIKVIQLIEKLQTILNYSDFNKAVFARNEVKLNRIYLTVPQIWQWH